MSNSTDKYCLDLHNYERFPTQEVKVGNIGIGNINPIRLQSMTNVSAMDIENSILQAKRIFDAGADFVRISTPRIMDVESLKNIKKILNDDGYKNPLIADIHFNPAIAEEAAKIVEKIRINPGNYVDKRSVSKKNLYSEKEYNLELEKIHSRILPLIKICKEYGTAIRIGSNHGSLSDRILNRYGNTIEGLVESLIEYLEIFKSENFYNIVVSIKSSDTRTMVKACRLLNAKMLKSSYVFPQHLGVTESGSGDEGRLKSAIGIGSLLADGIGDTIRVSLTEPPENEIAFAKNIADRFQNKEFHYRIVSKLTNTYNPFLNQKRSGIIPHISENYIVIGNYKDIQKTKPDIIYCDDVQNFNPEEKYIVPYKKIKNKNYPDNVFPLFKIDEITPSVFKKYNYFFIEQSTFDFNKEKFKDIYSKYNNNFCIIIDFETTWLTGEMRYVSNLLSGINKQIPLIIKYCPEAIDKESLIAESGIFPGSVLVDGLASGLWLNSNNKSVNPIELSFDLLQSTGLRISKTEFISCPACGRTEYDIENVSKEVKKAFSKLKGLKIAIMGCLVNGPGEMADADYGCVGASKGKVHIYKGKKIILKNIPENQIVEKLKEVIGSGE